MLTRCSEQSTQQTQQTDGTNVSKTFKKILAFRIPQTLCITRKSTMKIQADLDPKTVWAVVETAERLGINNSDVLELRLSGLRRQTVPERVKELHARNYSDADIADELGYLVARVATIRRRLGLPPNRRYPATTKEATNGPR